MGEDPNSIYIPQDLLKEIFLRLPLKSLIKFTSVSKEWRCILESKSFVDLHLSFQKSSGRRKILAAHHCDCGATPSLIPRSRLESELELVYLHCDETRPLMSFDGLVCIPEPGWVNVLNPSTRQLLRFPSGPDPVSTIKNPRYKCIFRSGYWSSFFPGYWAMGFGRDIVSGSYKVVRMFFDPSHCEILDVNIGEWRQLSPPPYEVDRGRRSTCVNGSIYWFEFGSLGFKILALDLHTEEFHDVAMPPDKGWTSGTQIVNFEGRLAIVMARFHDDIIDWNLEIWTLDFEQHTWSMTYFISLAGLGLKKWQAKWFTPLKVSMHGDVLIYDNRLSLLHKYSPHTNTVRQIVPGTCFVVSPHLENLVRFQVVSSTQSAYIQGPTCHFKDGIASGLGISSLRPRVDKLLSKGQELGISLWGDQMKMFAAFLFALLLSSFCTGDKVFSLPMVLFIVWMSSFGYWDMFTFFSKMFVLKLLMSMPLVFIVAVLSSGFTAILMFMAIGALSRRLLRVLVCPFQYLIENTCNIFYS